MRAAASEPAVARGMTLIELLVAFSIATVIAAIALMVFMTYLRTAARQHTWHTRTLPAAAMLDMFRRDCASVFAVTNHPGGCFNLAPTLVGGVPAAELRMLVTVRSGDAAWQVGESVYACGVPPETTTGATVVLSRSFTPYGPGVAKAATLVERFEGVRALEIAVNPGKGWTNRWECSRANAGWPRAARIRLVFDDQGVASELATECLIPAGITLQPDRAAGTNR